jgi:hypothetical protein
MAKLKPNQLAQQTALRGETDAAVTQLSANLAGGDYGAAASLAQIEAFRGLWPDALGHAYLLWRNPDSVYAANVLADAAHLVALAGMSCGGWADIQATLAEIHAQLSKDPKRVQDGYLLRLLDRVIALAQSDGSSSYSWDPDADDAIDEDARAAKFDEGVAKLTRTNKQKKHWKNDAQRRRHLFSLADNRRAHQSAIRLYDEEGIADVILFSSFAFTASSLSRAGRKDEAWRVIEKGFHQWGPVDVAQVAPVELLIDEGLRPLMTPERCAWVLRTPRGPNSAPAAA